LSPTHFEPQTSTQTSPNAVRATSADGTTPLPNPRLISDVIAQQPLGADGNAISVPNTFGTNLFLMSFGQFFDHGLDFYARGGGAFFVPIGDLNEQLADTQERLNAIRGNDDVQLDLTDNILVQLESNPQPRRPPATASARIRGSTWTTSCRTTSPAITAPTRTWR
jgi:hypothetical protein